MQETKVTKRYNGPKLFVGGLSPATTPHSLRSYFESLCPVQVVKVEFSRKSKNKKGFGYVIIDRPQDVDKLLRMSHFIDGKLVDVMPYSVAATTKWYNSKAESIKVKLRNVPHRISEQQVSLFFERYARVLVLNIVQERSTQADEVENVAYVELLNTYKPLRVGKRVFACNPNLIQSVSFFSIESLIGGLTGPYSAPLIPSLSLECQQLDSRMKIKSLLDFERATYSDKHSKYEFIKTQQSPPEGEENYRFNLRIPPRLSAGARLLARRVSSPAIPSGDSFFLIEMP